MVDALLATILFIVPGYVAVCTRRYWLFMPPPTDTAVGALVWSAVIYLILGLISPGHVGVLLQGNVNPLVLMGTPKLLGLYIAVIAFSAVLGFVAYWLLARDCVIRFLGQTPYEDVWDEFWCKNAQKDQTVAILTSNYEGWLGKLVCASGRGAEREVWLTNVWRYQDGAYTQSPCEHLVINCRDAFAVMMLPQTNQD